VTVGPESLSNFEHKLGLVLGLGQRRYYSQSSNAWRIAHRPQQCSYVEDARKKENTGGEHRPDPEAERAAATRQKHLIWH
jgi:hypothetical protein